jgi:hypothetical protein
MLTKNSVRESLYRVLRAFALADKELGYFQGMAFPASILIWYMDETRAF